MKLKIFEDKDESWERSLLSNGIHSHFIFQIETEEEEYNPDWTYLKVYHQPPQDEEHLFDWSDEMPYKVIRINSKIDKVSDLEKQVSEATGIPL